MTTRIYERDGYEYQISCKLEIDTLRNSFEYWFRALRRKCGKRKWGELPKYENQHRLYTDMEDLTAILSMYEIQNLAKEEHKSYFPTEELLFYSKP